MSNVNQGGPKKQDAKVIQQQWQPSKVKEEKKNGVPKLNYGHGDFHVFKQALSTECLTKYGNVGKLIELGKYYEKKRPNKLDVEFNTGDADDDKLMYVEALKAWARTTADMELKRPMMYGTIWSHMSPESVDEVKNQEEYATFSVDKDPEGLWQCIIATHGVNSISHVPGVVKQAAWQRYVSCRQGGFESLITYREQFDAALKAYEDHGNAKLSADDSAMHFFAGLDQGRYGQMKTTVHNNMTIGAQKPP